MPVKRINQPEGEAPADVMYGWMPGFPGPDIWKMLADDDMANSAEHMDIIGDMIINHGQMLVKHGQSLKRLAKLRGKKSSTASSGGGPDSENT